MKKKILFIVILFFILIPPVIALAADVQIVDDASEDAYYVDRTGGIYWISPDIGYIIFKEDNPTNGPVYRKTTNGGATWGSETALAHSYDPYASLIATWADWETPGGTGTVIHYIRGGWSFNANTKRIDYGYFDTYDESTDALMVQSFADVNSPATLDEISASITKTTGTALAIAYRTKHANDYGFEISTDGGNTWVTKDDPWETAYDYIRLFPANLSDQNDLWAVFWDISTDELSLKTYDYSTDSWDEDLISANITEDSNLLYTQWDGEIRHSDQHLIFAAWDDFNTVNATLRVWDIDGGDDITQLTPAVDVADASGYFQADVFIDQTTNRIYISYLKGTIGSSVSVYYQYSDDYGTTWSGEISYSESAGDWRKILTGGIRADLGGNFMPAWIEENGASSDIKTSLLNSIEISGYTYSSEPAIAPEYVIDCPTCTDNLTSSGNFTSNETFTGGPPGFSVIDDAAADSGGPPIWLWGWVGMAAVIAPGFFVTYMERKHGSGNGTLILRMGIALIVLGLLVTWQRFDWWMIVFYLIIAAAPALMSRQYDWGGAGGISQHGWIGFCATSWIGLTIINRILEGQFLTTSESSWWCSIQLFNEFRVFDLFTLPVLNFQFFTVGIPSLLRWDYSFFGGNAELIQYLLYTITAVVAFILFVILIGLLFNAFRAR